MTDKPTPPVLGSPERPLTPRIDTSEAFATCEHCGEPIYAGECWNALHVMHSHCAKAYTPEAISRNMSRAIGGLQKALARERDRRKS